MSPAAILDRMKQIDAAQAAIERDARTENAGCFSDEQRTKYETLDIEFKRLEAMISPRKTQLNSGSPLAGDDDDDTSRNRFEPPHPGWVNLRTGEPVATFSPRQRFADAHPNGKDVSIGRFLQALAVGNWKHAEPERRVMAMSSTDGSSGGHFLIPDELSSQVIDLARSASVVFPWGAQSVEMKSDSLRIAKLNSDPTFDVKAENEAFTSSNPTFGAIQLFSRTLGAVVTASRELAEDAPNFPTIIEDSLRRGLGAEMDRLILRGNGGSDGVDGIKVRSGIGSTSSVGAIAWEDFHEAATSIRALNHQPNGVVLHPTIMGDAQILTSGDGTNSAKLWLGPPPSLDGVAMLPTTGLTTADALVGDGTKILVGFRTQARVEMTTVADGAFEAHQAKWKITLRFDFGLTDATAFHLLTGITT